MVLFDLGFCIFQISSLVKSVRLLANMEEPIGQILKRTEVKAPYNYFNTVHK